jgi:uncharacterized protein YndB with AHSA1/START domain
MTTSPAMNLTLPSDTEILITRQFAAPRHAVWQVWTTPEHILRWWGGQRGVATLAEIDLRVGGTWRYAMTANAGFEVAFHGEFLEVVMDERIVSTEFFEGMPGSEAAVNTATFTEADGVTTLSLLLRYDSQATRDLVVGTGMEGGVREGFEIIDALLAG